MTETRRLQINAAANRYWRKRAAAHVAAGRTTRGQARKYRRWPTPGLPRGERLRIERRAAAALGRTTRNMRLKSLEQAYRELRETVAPPAEITATSWARRNQ